MPLRCGNTGPALAGLGICFTVSALALLLLLGATPAPADTYVVDRTDDSTVDACTDSAGDCALRGAILKANANPGADEIVLPAGTYTLSLAGTGEDLGATGDLDVRHELLLRGAGPELTVVDGGGIDRVFHVRASEQRLTLRGIQVTGGSCAPGDDGGGIRSQEGALRLETVWVFGNVCPDGSGGVTAGGCAPAQRTEIVDSWIADNQGGTYGGIYAGCPLYLERSTVSGNSGARTGGGIGLLDSDNFLLQCTIRGNAGPDASSPGGVRLMPSRAATIDACTFADNLGRDLQVEAGGAVDWMNTLIQGECGGPELPVSIGGNLESPGHTCGLGASDMADVADLGLSTFGWYGGPAPVLRPAAGSAAIDQEIAGPNGSPLDQRLFARPRDGDGDGGATWDIGAVELWAPGEVFLDGFECGFLTSWSLSAP